ncbi:MAG: SWIM zinc finger family protein [Deinococcota bacterium]|nr:SWIM zinc finger family protein [Deinococcota bacterium]
MLREHSSSASFERGVDYYRQGAVVSLEQRDKLLSAEVEGSEFEPYLVRVEFDDAGVTSASCTCPYEYGGWCKHTVATLLAVIEEPDLVEERQPLEELLEPLSASQLRQALRHLAEKHPETVRTLELHLITSSVESVPAKPKRQTPVDVALFRQLAKAAVRGAELDWDGNPDFGDLYEVIDKVAPFLEQGDYRNALGILEAVTAGFFEAASDQDYEGYFYDEWLYDKLDGCWAEAVLGAELGEGERVRLQGEIAAWTANLEHYSMSAFGMTDAALAQGWEYPPLVDVLRGEEREAGAWASEEVVPDFADDLARIRLRILEREGRHQEYLRLAKAEGLSTAYLEMLVKLGRVGEALEQAKGELSRPSEAFGLAKTLREQGEPRHALDIAEYGLGLRVAADDGVPRYGDHYQDHGENKYHLAAWTSELATGLGERERALRAAVTAFEERPSFADYQQLRELARETWPELKERLLASLRSKPGAGDAKVDIFLHEDLLRDAIAAVDDRSVYNDVQVRRVMDAATGTHPDWVIDNARRRAESIMAGGKAKYYHEAAEWLERVKTAHLRTGRKEAWQGCLAEIKHKHGRKYKLMGLLKDL